MLRQAQLEKDDKQWQVAVIIVHLLDGAPLDIKDASDAMTREDLLASYAKRIRHFNHFYFFVFTDGGWKLFN